MKKIFIYLFVAILALGSGFYAQQFFKLPAKQQAQPLLDFAYPDLTGRLRHVAEWQGKVLVINFWATWCAPCREEIPEFMALQKQFGAQGLQFVGIAIEDQTSVAKYIDTIHINYPILIAEDTGIELAQRFGNVLNAVPFTVLVNRQGQIVRRQPGEFSTAELLEEIKVLL